MVVTGLQPGAGGEQTPPEVYNYGAKWPMLAVRLDPLYARRYVLHFEVCIDDPGSARDGGRRRG